MLTRRYYGNDIVIQSSMLLLLIIVMVMSTIFIRVTEERHQVELREIRTASLGHPVDYAELDGSYVVRTVVEDKDTVTLAIVAIIVPTADISLFVKNVPSEYLTEGLQFTRVARKPPQKPAI